MVLKKYGLPCPEHQYHILPRNPMERLGLASGVSIEDRERFWAGMGVRPLA